MIKISELKQKLVLIKLREVFKAMREKRDLSEEEKRVCAWI